MPGTQGQSGGVTVFDVLGTPNPSGIHHEDLVDIVTILDSPSVFGGQAPRAGVVRETEGMQIHNADSIDHTITE